MMKITIDKVGQVLKSIHSLETNCVLVGIPQDKNARNDGQMTNASIGYIQENGSSANNIPARPFLIPGVEKVNKEAAEIMGQGATDALSGGDVMKSLTKAGILASSSVKKTLQAGEGFEPLSDSTLAQRKAKGFKGTKPLIRTGQLRNSITFVVKGK